MRETVTYKDAEGQKQENKEQMFGFERKRLFYVCGKQNYPNHLSKAGPYHANMTDPVLHFWRLGLKNDELVASMNLRSVPPFPSEFSTNTNVMKNVTRLAHVEAVSDEAENSSGMSRKLCPEQKPVDLMRAVLQKFTKPGTMVLDASLGTCSRAKAGLLER